MVSDALVTIPGYTIHRLLGVGGMAKVYLATQNSLQREVAIKVLLNPSDEQFSKRFMAEARIIAALNHPRVITIYDVAQMDDGCLYFAMEYLSGGDLSQFKGQVLPPYKALMLVQQIAEGLLLIHRNKIIHRDIKPANILFRSDDNLVLSDFGIAKNTLQNVDFTQTGYSVGSPSYGSPEQALEQDLDQRTDIYSLGVIFLEMLLGRNPFVGPSITETVVNHLQMDIPTLQSSLQSYQSLVNKMLAKKKEDRFTDVDELLMAINKAMMYSSYQNDETLVTRRSSKFTADWLESATGKKAGELFKKTVLSVVGVLCFIAVVFFLTYESETNKKIKQLLADARLSQQEARFDEPEANNAYYFYNQVLGLDSDNKEALAGLSQLKNIQVVFYLEKAKVCIENKRLSSPDSDNAIYFYKRVLQLEPENPAALAGIRALVAQFTRLAQQAFLEDEYRQGFLYLKEGLGLEPKDEVLLRMKEEYRHQSNAFKRLFNRVFKINEDE